MHAGARPQLLIAAFNLARLLPFQARRVLVVSTVCAQVFSLTRRPETLRADPRCSRLMRSQGTDSYLCVKWLLRDLSACRSKDALLERESWWCSLDALFPLPNVSLQLRC